MNFTEHCPVCGGRLGFFVAGEYEGAILRWLDLPNMW